MPQDFDSDELLVRYHLGELSQEDRDAVEDRFFADNAFHERVLAAEDELVDSYVRGELSTEQNKHFENWLLRADDRRKKLEFAKVLARYRPPQAAPRVFTAVKSVLQALHLSGLTEKKRPLFDSAYLNALRQRDPEAENDLINHFSRPVRLKLQARLRSAEQAEVTRRLVFDRVLAELRSPTSWDPGSLRAFVHAVCDEVALDMLETHYSGREIPPDTKRQLEFLECKHWARRRLRDSIEMLFRKKDRELLSRVLLSGEDRKLICREFGVDRGYLRDLVHQVRLVAKTTLVETKAVMAKAGEAGEAMDRVLRLRARMAEWLAATEEESAPKHPGTDSVK